MIRRATLLKTCFGLTDTVQENSWNLSETKEWLEMLSCGSNNGTIAFLERREAKKELETLLKMPTKTNFEGRMKEYWLSLLYSTPETIDLFF